MAAGGQRGSQWQRRTSPHAWFVDCDATGECFDDYHPLHPASRSDDTGHRRHRLRWLEEHRHLFGLTAFVGDYQLHPDTEVYRDPSRFGVTVIDQDNGYCRYVVAKGISQEDLKALKSILALNNNRTLVCNSAHLPHLVESGLDLSGLERPMTLPKELIAATT